jgi:CBS domain-containing protein
MGVIVAYGLVVLGIVLTFTGALITGLWFIFIGWFLKNASETSYQQLLITDALRGAPIANLLNETSVSISPETTLRQLADSYILPQGRRYFPVTTEGGALLGLITLTDIRQVPPSDWDTTTVYRAMTPAAKLHTLSPKDDAFQAFHLMTEHDIHQLPVLDDSVLLGFVTRADVMRLLQTRSEMRQI